MNDTTFIGVSGYFGSGSSAVVDLLKEYRNTYECLAEIRIIKDPYGICELEHALTDGWELLNSAAAIRDFLWLSKICSRPGKMPWSRPGLGYRETINKDYMKITQTYIEKLSDFQYKSDFYYQKFKKNYFRYVTDRCRLGLERLFKGKIRISNYNMKPSYFAKPTHDEFNKATQEYFAELFKNYTKKDEENFIILDQAISPNNTQVIHRYFEKAKLIIVDRDPRDIFIEGIRWGETKDLDMHTAEAGRKYVIKHLALRDNLCEDADVLNINFEDLVLDYEASVRRIEEFLGFPSANHENPKKYLQPEKSSKNVALWKKYYNDYKAALDVIHEELPQYCYE